MISSLPIFVITATELAARRVAARMAMPIDCLNTDSKAGQRLTLTHFSRSIPDPRGPSSPKQCLASVTQLSSE